MFAWYGRVSGRETYCVCLQFSYIRSEGQLLHSLMKDDIGTHLFLLYLENRNASSLPPLWLQGMAILGMAYTKRLSGMGVPVDTGQLAVYIRDMEHR